jgi:membrane associated rhomboid family serine protease
MFQHTGILHLVINSIAFIGMFRSLEKCVNKWTLSVSIILTAFVTSFFSMYEIPTVGASSMIYAAIGIFIALSSISDKIKIVDRRKYALFILAVILSLTVSGFKPNSNFWLHAYSLLFGIPIGGIIWLYNGR